jgi:hypothetical protein
MRINVGMVVLLALLPITLSVVSFYSAHFILSAPDRVEWVSLGSPPGGAIEFVDQKRLIRGANGNLYWSNNGEWILKSDELLMETMEFDESCPSIVLPSDTVDLFQDCRWVSNKYYAILKDGTVWYYSSEMEDDFRIAGYVLEFTIKVLASVVGLAIGVGVLAVVGIMGIYRLPK